MKQFNLEEYLKNPLKKVVTRDGQSVKIHCTNFDVIDGRRIVAEIEGSGYSTTFFEDGKYFRSEETPSDLFFAPEKYEGWVNIYRYLINNDPYCNHVIYASEEEARHNSGTACATVKIEWEE